MLLQIKQQPMVLQVLLYQERLVVFQMYQLVPFQMLKVVLNHKQKSQLDLMRLYNIQHKIEQLQQVITKQKF